MEIVTQIKLDTKELDRLIKKVPAETEHLIKITALSVQGEAAMRAPVDTTALANSIEAVQVGPFSWRVQDGVHYGIYQELGFVHYISGAWIQNPFMIPAVEKWRPYFESRVMELLR